MTITQPLTQQASDEALAFAAWIKAEDRDEFDIAMAIDAYCKEELRRVIESVTKKMHVDDQDKIVDIHQESVRLAKLGKSFI